ncbi:MAG: rhodanese-like domain-containing protein [Colwellia sp.]
MLKTIPQLIAHARESLKTLTAKEAAVKCKSEHCLLIDVREPSEFIEKSAEGAINIPRGVLEMKMLQVYPDEMLTIFIHCATGARATLAAEQLKRIGYKDVWVITCQLEDICIVNF